MPLLGTIGLIAAGCRRSVFLTDRSCEPLRRARAPLTTTDNRATP